MAKVIEWLKKIFTANILTLIVTCIAAWFAYQQYVMNNSGQITPYIYEYEVVPNRNVIFIKTNDTIKVIKPELPQRAKNTSKYSISNLKLIYTVSSYINSNPTIKIFPNKCFVEGPTSVDYNTNTVSQQYTYKTDRFYAGDITPIFLDSLIFLPQEQNDTLNRHFDITTEISWEGGDSKNFFSRFWYRQIEDDKVMPKYYLDRIDKQNYEPVDPSYWYSKACDLAKKYFPKKEKAEIILLYHVYNDSISVRGVGGHFYDISVEEIDSIRNIKTLSRSFLSKHLYGFNYKEISYNINWIDALFAILFFLSFIFVIVLWLRNRNKSFKYNAIAIMALLVISAFILYFSNDFFLNHFDRNPDVNKYLYYSWINIIVFSLAILSSFIFIIMMIIRIYKYILGSDKYVKHDWLDYASTISGIALFASIIYLFFEKFQFYYGSLSQLINNTI